MEVPLSRFLARFSLDDDHVEPEPAAREDEPEMIPAVDPIEIRLAAARAETEAVHADELASLRTKLETEAAEALISSRTQWCESEGGKLATQIDEAMQQLRTDLADRVADVLTPLVAQSVVARTRAVLMEALDTLLADENHPVVTIRAPADLVEAVRTSRPDAKGIRYVAHDDIDALITADGLQIQTRLESALKTLAEAGD